MATLQDIEAMAMEQSADVVISGSRTQSVASLQKFMGQDFLRSSQFLFMLPIYPAFIDTPASLGVQSRALSYLCEAVEFPGSVAQVTDYKIPGTNKIRVPYSRDLNEITMTFIHSVETPVYRFFYNWIESAFGRDNPTTENLYFDECTADMQLLQFTDVQRNTKSLGGLTSLLNDVNLLNSKFLDSSNLFNATSVAQKFVNKINSAQGFGDSVRDKYYTINFKNAYPVSVANMPSNWSDDGFHRVTVNWAYESFTVI
jgi:hypothetical protein